MASSPDVSGRAAGLAAIALVGGAGCGFRSAIGNPDNPGDAGGDIPDGSPIDARIDAPVADARIDAPGDDPPPGAVCYGPAGPWQVCLDAAPARDITLPAQLDTDASPLCLTTQPAAWTRAQSSACFIVGDLVTVPLPNGTRVTGKRPLVLLGATAITVDGVLDIAGRHGAAHGVPSSSSVCQPFARGPEGSDGDRGGGGGAGGSFVTAGGNGGDGGGPTEGGQASQPDLRAPTRLRGGCAGQAGGGRGPGDGGAGSGGGAVYLLSRGTITFAQTGAINASGGGAAGGGPHTGGSGAGSGGMIVLYSSAITALASVLIANGGGAAGGATEIRGSDGSDPSVLLPDRPAGGGGNGGAGFSADIDAVSGTAGAPGNGGGGGGGGAGYIRSNQPLGIAVVSPAVQIVP